jgi:hypothetical protein
MTKEPDTQELRDEQMRREIEEQTRAHKAQDEEEFAQHERRAEKARYLRGKLEQRAESEREQQ